jgi:CO dehydrogenase/acetyl-CoA synthase gamma subunit (corrinoid Fe-S protein)
MLLIVIMPRFISDLHLILVLTVHSSTFPAMSAAKEQSASSSDSLPFRQGAKRAEEIRALCPRFRILIIGKANSGKTTILRKVCNAKPDAKPLVYDAEGDLIEEVSLAVRPEVQHVPTKVRLENLTVLAKTNQKPGVIMVVELLAV